MPMMKVGSSPASPAPAHAMKNVYRGREEETLELLLLLLLLLLPPLLLLLLLPLLLLLLLPLELAVAASPPAAAVSACGCCCAGGRMKCRWSQSSRAAGLPSPPSPDEANIGGATLPAASP